MAETTTENQATPNESEKPFIIEHRKLDLQPSGSFRPGAVLILSPALRTSGLLASLPAEELKSLLYVLTFLTSNGYCRPALQQLAHGMRTSPAKVEARMSRLAAFLWRDEPLVHAVSHETGMTTYSPSHQLTLDIHAHPISGEAADMPKYRPAGREAIIAHSRANYSLPRAEAEKMVLKQLGHSGDALGNLEGLDHDRQEVLDRLVRLGLSQQEGAYLVLTYEPDRIREQLEWLPYRHAKRPDRLIRAAITEGYDAPVALRKVLGLNADKINTAAKQGANKE